MTRTEYLRAYCDLQRDRRNQTKVRFTSAQESDNHIIDRMAAATVWRRNKNRLQSLGVDEWRKQETK